MFPLIWEWIIKTQTVNKAQHTQAHASNNSLESKDASTTDDWLLVPFVSLCVFKKKSGGAWLIEIKAFLVEFSTTKVSELLQLHNGDYRYIVKKTPKKVIQNNHNRSLNAEW